ncbi:hypothetical protein ACSDR0_37335 [Streptosporangium sp. G11]|uniref:hypothetical protein n=1 Tax=Streptosporangium sp. G11 TaxID=3436926 RepID=UPI003EBB8BC1
MKLRTLKAAPPVIGGDQIAEIFTFFREHQPRTRISEQRVHRIHGTLQLMNYACGGRGRLEPPQARDQRFRINVSHTWGAFQRRPGS